jgi:hypothetical protein
MTTRSWLKGRRGTAVALVVGTALASGLSPGPAEARSSNLRTTPDATYQTNGRVAAMVSVGHTLYIGGSFTSVRPAGDPEGTGEVARARLAAFDKDTGALLPWNPGVNNPVNALAASPDGHTIYVGGRFGRLAGASRQNVGAVSAGAGTIRKFKADANGRVMAIATHGSKVYLGGKFTTVRGAARARLAAVSTSGRVQKGWHAQADANVQAVAISRNGRSLFAGGAFTTINGRSQHHLAKLSRRHGRVQHWKSHPSYPVSDLVVTRHRLYLAGDGAGGHAAAYSTRGRFHWVVQTDGSARAVALLHGVVYVGGQFHHVCVGNHSGPDTGFDCPKVKAARQRLMALSAKSGALDPWAPDANSILGVFVMTTTPGRLHVGGEFTQIGGRAQQGYARFSAA